jgi:hypothetical protein
MRCSEQVPDGNSKEGGTTMERLFNQWLTNLSELNGDSFSPEPGRAYVLASGQPVTENDQQFQMFLADWDGYFSTFRKKIEGIWKPGFYRFRIKSQNGESLEKFHPMLKRHAYNSQITGRPIDLIIWMRMTDHGLYLQEVSELPAARTLQIECRTGFWALVQEPFVFQFDLGWKSTPFLRACRFIERERRLTAETCLPALTWIFAAGTYDVIQTADDALHNKLNFAQARKLIRAARV